MNKMILYLSIYLSIGTVDVYSLSIQKPLVSLWHYAGRGATLENLQKHGLLTARDVFEKGLSARDPNKTHEPLPGHHDVVYFRPQRHSLDSENQLKSLFEYVVEHKVNPERVRVYNQEFRVYTPRDYESSGMAYEKFMEKMRQFERAQDLLAQGKLNVSVGHYIRMNPYNASVESKKIDQFERDEDVRCYPYIPEVTLPHSLNPEDINIYNAGEEKPIWRGFTCVPDKNFMKKFIHKKVN